MKKIPYGISNFQDLITSNYLYLDKTRFIETLEQENAPYQFFIRPRRFGKTLFLSMLSHYYDINQRESFDQLFGELYIGQNPTPERNRYFILRFSFAAIVTSLGKERLIDSFEQNVRIVCRGFVDTYKQYLSVDKIPDSAQSADSLIQFIVDEVARAGQKIFVLIDEYDNFANDLISGNQQKLYYDLIQGEGYVRSFYKALKDGTSVCISRLFMTGVSPILLDDLTSGFNITENLTNQENINEIMGFTTQELTDTIRLLQADKIVPLNTLLTDMKKYYNGYLFNSQATERVFNTDMVLYFLNQLQKEKAYPRNVLDNNVKTDYRKIRELAFHFRDTEMIDTLLKEGNIANQLIDRFPLQEMYTKRENFASLMYYIGMLTIEREDPPLMILQIPNFVVRTIYWEYFLSVINDVKPVNTDKVYQALKAMRSQGTLDLFLEVVSEVLQNLSHRDLIKFDEKYIKAVMLTLIHIDGLYMIHSEYELENGYADILLVKDLRYAPYIDHEWLLELKYLKESDRDRLPEVLAAGQTQLKKYQKDKLPGIAQPETLHTAVLVVIGKGDIVLG